MVKTTTLVPVAPVLLALTTTLASQKVRSQEEEEMLPMATQKGQTLEGTGTGEAFGFSVALSTQGITMAVGAYGADSFTGVVRVYRLTDGAWVQLGNDIVGEAAGDQFG